MTKDRKWVSAEDKVFHTMQDALEGVGCFLSDEVLHEISGVAQIVVNHPSSKISIKNEDIEIEKIAEILCDSGEDSLCSVGESIKGVLDDAGAQLDSACCTSVVVVKTEDGKFLVGEFGFEFREVFEEDAKRVAKDFSVDEEDEDPPRGPPDIQGISKEKVEQIVEEFKKGETPKERP